MIMFERSLRVLEAVDAAIIKLCTVLGTLFCMGLAGSVIVAVTARFVFNNPLAWSEEIPKYCMIWMTFLGAPVVARNGGHVALDSWHGGLKPWHRHILRLLIALSCCALLGLFVGYGWRSTLSAQYQRIIVLGDVSMFWVYLAVPLGSALFLYSCLVTALKELAALCGLSGRDEEAAAARSVS